MSEVHHMTYANVGNEKLFELLGVCSKCHQFLHGRRKMPNELAIAEQISIGDDIVIYGLRIEDQVCVDWMELCNALNLDYRARQKYVESTAWGRGGLWYEYMKINGVTRNRLVLRGDLLPSFLHSIQVYEMKCDEYRHALVKMQKDAAKILFSHYMSKPTDVAIVERTAITPASTASTELADIRESLKMCADVIKSFVTVAMPKMKELEDKVNSLGAHVYGGNAPDDGYSTIIARAKLLAVRIPPDIARNAGSMCAAFCKRNGIKVGKLPDKRWGEVGVYPYEVIDEVFKKIGLLQ